MLVLVMDNAGLCVHNIDFTFAAEAEHPHAPSSAGCFRILQFAFVLFS